MSEVSFYAPKTLEEALGLINDLRQQAVILAGGTDLVPKMNYNKIHPNNIIYINNIGLNYIKKEDGKIKIGATTTLAELLKNKVISENASVLKDAVKVMGSMAIRNAATIGGNLVNASPAADSAIPLMILDAELVLKSNEDERTVKVEEFFTGPGETVLKSNEILVEIIIPVCSGKSVFKKLGKRKSETLSIVNTGARVVLEEGYCKEARIAIGSVAPTPLRCRNAEKILENKKITEEVIQSAVDAVIEDISPIDDQRATAWYRKQVAGVLMKRTLNEACNVIPEEEGEEK